MLSIYRLHVTVYAIGTHGPMVPMDTTNHCNKIRIFLHSKFKIHWSERGLMIKGPV